MTAADRARGVKRIAHVGPPIAQQGGPAGYLRQLRAAAAASRASAEVFFPSDAIQPAALPRRRSSLRRLASAVRSVVRTPPRFYRPPDEILRADHGHVEAVMTSACAGVLAASAPSFELARERDADVLFCHESPAAEEALARRTARQQVWLMLHAPMPLALYLVWNWGVPEKDWREVMAFPDVRRWTAWELDVWRRVDRLIIPSLGAFDELVRISPAAEALRSLLTPLLSGASAKLPAPATEAPPANNPPPPSPALPPADRLETRRRFGLPPDGPVALYLGNGQPYRGLDALTHAADRVPPSVEGVVAVAGPRSETMKPTERLRPLGPVADVSALLEAVDFVVNVNRFSLFDLSTIEALEAAKPVLLHAIGGNRTFAQLGAGCQLMDDLRPDTVAAGLERMFALSANERDALGRQSRRCYEDHLTLTHLWDRHAALYAAAEPVAAR